MNIVMWLLAGGIVGWAGYSFTGFDGRSKMVSVLIGAVGGFLGGKVVAPMFAAAAAPGDFSASALFFAAAVAAAFLAVGNRVHHRWGF